MCSPLSMAGQQARDTNTEGDWALLVARLLLSVAWLCLARDEIGLCGPQSCVRRGLQEAKAITTLCQHLAQPLCGSLSQQGQQQRPVLLTPCNPLCHINQALPFSSSSLSRKVFFWYQKSNLGPCARQAGAVPLS